MIQRMRLKHGFTLAEVLVTLGIIGIVAAMTFPSLIGKWQKMVTVNKLKEAYTIISQGVKSAEADYGAVKYWEFRDKDDFTNKYIKPYYQVLKVYESGELPAGFHHYCQDGSSCDSYGAFTKAQKLILKNGMMLSMDIDTTTNNYVWLTITIDINGLKNFSTYGRDTFIFSLDPADEKLLPYGLGRVTGEFSGTNRDKSRNALLSGADTRSCTKAGLYCGAVIFLDNWEIKDDYPW